MASSLLALLDDIATVLDDVALMTKVAAKKTAGVLGDDLALNAQQVSGVRPDRELPVVWKVARGSLANKAILVPIALLLSAVAPFLVLPLLMIGGAFLAYEGCEKVAHKFLHSKDEDSAHHAKLAKAAATSKESLLDLEKRKIQGAIRTDFILSAEIIAITLGTVADAPFAKRLMVLVTIAVVMTLGVYGLVAAIVKLDDLGLLLSKRPGTARKFGDAILQAAPYLMKGLSIAGTVAMFLVGGGILVHGIPPVHHGVEALAEVPAIGAVLPTLATGVFGIVAGAVILVAVNWVKRVVGRERVAGKEGEGGGSGSGDGVG